MHRNSENDSKLKDSKIFKFFGRHKKLIIIILIIAAAVAILINKMKSDRERAAKEALSEGINTSTVMRGDVSNELTSSGTLEPKDTYTITSQVSGEVLQADFEEGDEVEKGDVLYVIDQSDISNNVDQTLRNLDSAKESYEQAKIEYDEAISDLGGGTVKASQSGYVRNITLKAGDTLNQGSNDIAELYNDSAMTVRLAFLSTDADSLSIVQDVAF